MTVSDSAGLEIVTVSKLPDVNDTAMLWRLSLIREISGGGAIPDDPVVLYDPKAAARLDEGALVVFDNGPQRLLVIDPEVDSVVRRFAPRGRGPGEITGDGVVLVSNEDGTITAVELWGNRRIHRFTRTGVFVEDIPLAAAAGGADPGRIPQEISVHVFSRSSTGWADSIAWLNLTTGRVDAVAPLPERFPEPPGGYPYFYPIHLWTSLRSGSIVIGRTDSGILRCFSGRGVLEREIRLPITPREVSEQVAARVLEEWGESVPVSKLRSRFYSHHRLARRLVPVSDSVFAMEHSWMSQPSEDESLPEGAVAWRLFTEYGRPVGVVRFPPGFTPWVVDGGRVVGVLHDSLGVATVQEYTLKEPRHITS